MTTAPLGRRHTLCSPGGRFAVAVDESGARIASIVETTTSTEFLLRFAGRDTEEPEAPPAADSNRRWHERYAGGWHPLLPHAGDDRTVAGVAHPFHGEAAWRRWRTVAVDDSSCTLEVALDTVPLVLRRRTEATADGVRVRQRLENTSAADVVITWTEHPSFGEVLAGPDASLTVAGSPVDVHFPAPNEGHGGFRSVPVGAHGVARLRSGGWDAVLAWDPALFPQLHVWQEHRFTSGFPWWGAVSTIALEPASRPYDATDDTLGPIVVPAGGTVAAEFSLSLTPTGPGAQGRPASAQGLRRV
jgi:galactose mutarotase-like enzyme